MPCSAHRDRGAGVGGIRDCGVDLVARRAYVPPELASSARELLLAFADWAAAPAQEALVDDESWTWAQMIDMFLMECGANDEVDPP